MKFNTKINMNKFIVAIDFDGTIAKQEEDLVPRTLIPNAKEVINWMYDNCYIIIWTCRNDKQLQVMVNFLKANKIKYHTINKNAPFLDFETSRKIFSNLYIDDRGLCLINWKEIKEKVKKLIELEKKAQQMADMPLMSRGKFNDECGSVGMDEGVQKMYDGKDRSHAGYEQLELVDNKNNKTKISDWIDRETLIKEVMQSGGQLTSKKKAGTDSNYLEEDIGWTSGNPGQRSYPYSKEDSLSYYYNNPKGKGDPIPEVFDGLESYEQPESEDMPVLKDKTKGYRRDETEKYLTTDQKLYRNRYWDEKSDNVNRGLASMKNIKKIAKEILSASDSYRFTEHVFRALVCAGREDLAEVLSETDNIKKDIQLALQISKKIKLLYGSRDVDKDMGEEYFEFFIMKKVPKLSDFYNLLKKFGPFKEIKKRPVGGGFKGEHNFKLNNIDISFDPARYVGGEKDVPAVEISVG